MFSILNEEKIIMENLDVNCYLKIIEYFESGYYNCKEIIILVCKILLKLMKLLESGIDKEIITNSIILAISYLQGLAPDSYNNIGEDCKSLLDTKKKKAISQLKVEFIPN